MGSLALSQCSGRGGARDAGPARSIDAGATPRGVDRGDGGARAPDGGSAIESTEAPSRLWAALGMTLSGHGDNVRAQQAIERAVADVLAAGPRAGPDPEGYARELYSASPSLVGASAFEREQRSFVPALVFSTVYETYRAGGRPALETLRRSPPETTERLLHPGDGAGERVREIPPVLLPSLAREYQLADQDTAGELGAVEFFAAALPRSLALSAARGWGGDRAVLGVSRANGGEPLALWYVWCDAGPAARVDAEAVEFAEAAGTVLTRRHGGFGARGLNVWGATVVRDAGEGRVALVARAGRMVLVAEGVPARSSAAVVRDFVVNPP